MDRLRVGVSRSVRLAIIGLVLVTLAGCHLLSVGRDDVSRAHLRNETSKVLVVTAHDGEREYPVADGLEPQTTRSIGRFLDGTTNCTTVTFLAHTEDGEEVAHRDEPICAGEVWEIRQTPPPGSSP